MKSIEDYNTCTVFALIAYKVLSCQAAYFETCHNPGQLLNIQTV